MDWGQSGTILGKLFDSNGTTLLQSVQATTTAITSGGIAFRAIGSFNKYWDTVQVTAGVNSFAAPASTGVAANRAAAVRRANLAMLASNWSPMTFGRSPQAMTSASAVWVDPAGTGWWWASSAHSRRTAGLLDELSALAADEFFRRF